MPKVYVTNRNLTEAQYRALKLRADVVIVQDEVVPPLPVPAQPPVVETATAVPVPAKVGVWTRFVAWLKGVFRRDRA